MARVNSPIGPTRPLYRPPACRVDLRVYTPHTFRLARSCKHFLAIPDRAVIGFDKLHTLEKLGKPMETPPTFGASRGEITFNIARAVYEQIIYRRDNYFSTQ